MTDLRDELAELVGAMTEEEVIMVLAYARCVRAGSVPSLEELVEEPA